MSERERKLPESRQWQIRLTSKHTGSEQWLGFTFETEAEAQEYADKEVCSRCNRISISKLPYSQYTRLGNGRYE